MSTFTLRLCLWHPWKMRRRIQHPVELAKTVRRELTLQRWAREHGHDYYDLPEWAWPKPIPEGWWTLYRCLQQDCDGLFYLGENAPMATPDEAVQWGLNLPAGWSWCPKCGCSSGCGVAEGPVRCGPEPSPAFLAASDQHAAADRERSKWLEDGHRKFLGIL